MTLKAARPDALSGAPKYEPIAQKREALLGGHFKMGISVAAVMVAAGLAHAQVSEPPPWAFPVPAPGTPAPATTDEVAHLPGSNAAFTLAQVRDRFNVADWHPGDHPP